MLQQTDDAVCWLSRDFQQMHSCWRGPVCPKRHCAFHATISSWAWHAQWARCRLRKLAHQAQPCDTDNTPQSCTRTGSVANGHQAALPLHSTIVVQLAKYPWQRWWQAPARDTVVLSSWMHNLSFVYLVFFYCICRSTGKMKITVSQYFKSFFDLSVSSPLSSLLSFWLTV